MKIPVCMHIYIATAPPLSTSYDEYCKAEGVVFPALQCTSISGGIVVGF